MVYILFKCALPQDKRREFHEVYQHQAKLLEEHGGRIIGVWNVEMGPCSDWLMIWAAEDLNAYQKTLSNLAEDPRCKGLYGKFLPMFISNCERWLLRPAPYSPLQ